MIEIGEPVPHSAIVTEIEEGLAFAPSTVIRWSCGPRTRLAAPAAASSTSERELLETLEAVLRRA